MKSPSTGPTLVLALILTMGAAAAVAQRGVRRSQGATVGQTVAQTEISIVYNRPVARGRTPIPDVVRWGRAWNPGANEATSIEFSHAVNIEGQPLPAGTYTLWMIPQPDEWTVIFSSAVDIWHEPYRPGRDVLRVRVRPQSGDHMEVLAFYFPEVGPDHATLRLHWGRTVVPIAITLAER
jgi:hypothetical protein